jgi:deoxyribonuclease-1
LFLLWPAPLAWAGPVEGPANFAAAKRVLAREVYHDHRQTVYCGAEYDERGRVIPPPGFTSPGHEARAARMEWEHLVPAEKFARNFMEWREGHEKCVDGQGRAFRGRRCAGLASHEYRAMESDMNNLAPAIGAVNALRRNYDFTLLPERPNTFGLCPMKIYERQAEPPPEARGFIARAYLHMAATYTGYSLSTEQQYLMLGWNREYPPDEWECLRARRIAARQSRPNVLTLAICGQH